MIPDKHVEMALDYMRDNASALAVAKAERVYLEEFRKSKKALLVQESKGTVLERESYAYAHPDYVAILDGLKEAVRQEEELRWMMIAAQTKVEVWRTQAANNRAMDRAHQ